MRKLLVVVIFLSGCATQQPQTTGWVPTVQWWKDAYFVGGRLPERNGTMHFISSLQAQNIANAMGRVGKTSGIDAQVLILKSDTINAYATVHNGKNTVGFTLPFISALGNDADAVATVVGHELAHLHYGHGDARKERSKTAAGASQVIGTILNVAGVPMGGTLASLGTSAITASFSRDEEREADELGLRWATTADYDPCGSVRAMRILQQAGGFQLPFFSTHPGHDERIERANTLAGKSGKAC